MGFFKDLREDISQAVNELLPDDSFWGLGEEAGETVAATESEAVEDVLGGIEPIQEEDLDGTDNLEADEQEILEKLQKFASSEVEDEKKVTQEDWVSGFDGFRFSDITNQIDSASQRDITDNNEEEKVSEQLIPKEVSEQEANVEKDSEKAQNNDSNDVSIEAKNLFALTPEDEKEDVRRELFENESGNEETTVVQEEQSFAEQERTEQEDVGEATEEEQNKEIASEEPTEEEQSKENASEEPIEEEQSKENASEEPTEEEQSEENASEEPMEEEQSKENASEEPIEEEQSKEIASEEPTEEQQSNEFTSEEAEEEEQSVEIAPEEATPILDNFVLDKTQDENFSLPEEDLGKEQMELGNNETININENEEVQEGNKMDNMEGLNLKDDFATDISNEQENAITEEKGADTMENNLENAEVKDEVTVITKGTVINGSISSDGSLEVNGTITGDVECLGKLAINGNVSGHLKAAEVVVSTPRLDGGIESHGDVKVGVGTIVLGDVSAKSATISGAVRGEIDVNGPVVVDSTAIVKGNITAKSVQINNGAVVDGYCKLSYAEVDIDNFFDEN